MAVSRPIITLTTDFGLGDHFVGSMKGVILGICPGASIVDISHQIRPYEVGEGGFQIAQAYRCFPKKAVHVVVVDPGVGSARRPLLVEAGGQYFIGPDNGIFAMILARETHKVRAITAERYFRKPVSQTFHGRDIFAPVAAHLAKGVTPAKFGKAVDNYLKPPGVRPERTARRGWTGQVLHVDRFGNVITNFHMDDFAQVATGAFEIAVGLQRVGTLQTSYAAAPFGELFVIAGSSGYLEIAANQNSAAKMLGCAAGAPVDLTLF